ncbi:MAG: thermonuclease family protein [Pseudomonadota bacterium]
MFRLCSLLLALAFGTPPAADTLVGTIRVVDGDTVVLDGRDRVRLVGIDAPEAGQMCRDRAGVDLACGRMATAAVRRSYEGRAASCRVEGYDRGGRTLAVCFVDGIDMNGALVAAGLARVYREGLSHADLRYAEAQKAAVLMGRGLWAYEMVDPALFRAAGRAPAAAPPSPACPIKGNVSENGRIYHLPGQAFYDRTRIDPGRGEQWFCSERDARAAGWRRAQR